MDLTIKSHEQDYSHLNLQNVVKALKEHYYDTICILCDDAESMLINVPEKLKDSATSTYLGFCKGLISKLKEVVRDRVNVLMPYIYVLNKKNEEKHDCSTCSTNCGIEHRGHLLNLKATASEIMELIKVFTDEKQPNTSQQDTANNHKALEKEMQMLTAAANRLFYLEETFLIPKIKGVQKNIHVLG